jgi:hypothetical protein
MMPFRLAPLALLLVAPFASAQTPVFEVRDASGATLHFAVNDDGTVTCTDCISPDEVRGGLFNGMTRDRLYLRSEPRSITSSGAILAAVTSCDSVDHVPVTGSCFMQGSQEVMPLSWGPLDWEDPTLAASYTCKYRSLTASTVTFQARIWCLDVTPEATTRTDDSLDLGASRTGDL